MNDKNNQSAQDITDPRIEKNVWCSIIAALEVLGGISILVIFFLNYGSARPNYWLALVLTPAIWGIYGGALLWMGRPKGLTHSIYIQALQILTLEGPFIAWELYLGLHFNIGWLNPGTVFGFGVGGSSFFHYSNPNLFFGAAVNVIALAAFIYLLKFRKKLEKQRQLASPNEELESAKT